MDTGKLVKAYIRLRDASDDLYQKYKAESGEIKRKMEIIESALLDQAKEHGLDSMKTPYGTAFRRVLTRYNVANWGAFKEFLKEQGDEGYDLVEARIHQTNFKEFLENNPDIAPPVNADSRYTIVVRRGNKS
jgi:hypothetical protein